MQYHEATNTYSPEVTSSHAGTQLEKDTESLIQAGASAWETCSGSGWYCVSKQDFTEFHFDHVASLETVGDNLPPILAAAPAVALGGKIGIVIAARLLGLGWEPSTKMVQVFGNDGCESTTYWFMERSYDEDLILDCFLGGTSKGRLHINPGCSFARIADGLAPIAYTEFAPGVTHEQIPAQLLEGFRRLF